jgi:hypothetical protein
MADAPNYGRCFSENAPFLQQILRIRSRRACQISNVSAQIVKLKRLTKINRRRYFLVTSPFRCA